ncbi:MAG: right-handed parallel beta-helix repeat-containing protein [Carboxydocellales bacterium]
MDELTDNIDKNTNSVNGSSEIDKITYTQEIELKRFGIKNDGTSPQVTSTGLNQALQYAKAQGSSKIMFPKGTYLIDETMPIVIDFNNIIIDLNGAILQINTNGLEKYSIVEFREGADNVRLTNGTIRGDKDTHDYLTLKSPHEWGCGVVFKSGRNLQFDNITVTNVTGYGIYTESGVGANRFYTLYTKDVIQGSISDDGKPVESTNTTRTSKPYDVTVCGGQFELGYTLGYQGYPFLLSSEYTAYFYDQNMYFIQKKICLQFRKIDIPNGAKYVHFVFPQNKIGGDVNGTYAWITNLKPPADVKLTDCLIKGNRSLGLAFTGGQKWIIENNIFEGNGGNAPSLAVDFEDGWELMQDVMFRNNKFISNNNDLVVSAGDNLVFEGNEFQKGAYFWERTTNYKVIGNKFNGGNATYKIKRAGCEVRDNQYTNTRLSTISLSSLTIELVNETLIDTAINATTGTGTKLVNSKIRATGKPFIKNSAMENCLLEIAFAEAFNLSLKDCRINNTHLNLHTEQSFENCAITDSTFSTHSDTTKIQFKNSEIINSQMLYSTWGAATETIFEQCKVTMNKNLPLVRISAGKTRNLIFKNNTVLNQIAKPVIELYDTIYTVPNGNATIEDNSFTLTKYGYVFDGVNITKGIFNFTDENNIITGAAMLNPKYIGNNFFNIIR